MLNRTLLIAAALVTAAAATAKTEPNSFLNRTANTHSALMSQIKTDSVVMGRFTRHFGMTSDQVTNYFSQLRAGVLKQDGVYLVYNCDDRTEEIRAKVIFYKKGTPVWEDSNGVPILKMSCANPMVRGTDDLLAVVEPEVSAQPVGELRGTEAVPTPQAVIAPEVETEILATDIEVSASALPIAGLAPALPAAAAVGSSAAAFSPALLIPLAAGATLLTDTGTGSTSNPGPPPVPEPGTMLALAAGGAFMAARRRKKNA